MASITGSVGQGGENQAGDVLQVQAWLNARLGGTLTIDGVCGPLTIAAIKTFQAGVRGVVSPDGLISPNGATLLALMPTPTAGPSPISGGTASIMPGFQGSTMRLVDFSHNNVLPDDCFAALKNAGVGAVILKASQGASFRDPTFPGRLASAQAAGLRVAAYHFGTGEPVADQLSNFLGAVTAAHGDFASLVAALDLEPNPADPNTPPSPPHTMSLDQGEAWVAGFRAQVASRPLVYGGANYLGTSGGAHGRPNLAACPLWLAAYPYTNGTVPSPLAGWPAWTLWQYTDGTHGCYAGAAAGLACDQSVFRGDEASLAALWRSLLAAPALEVATGA